MKNLKRILSFFIVMGFMFVMFGFKVGVRATVRTVTYTVTSKTTVSKSGYASAPNATYSQTYNSQKQATAGNSFTLTVPFSSGATIRSVTMSMKSNKSSGAGTLDITLGGVSICSIADATAFNDSLWHGSYSQEYVPVVKSGLNATADSDCNLVIHIAATTHSLFCESYTIEYDDGSVTPVIEVSGQASLMVGSPVTFTATPSNINPTPASFTWNSTNTSVATVSSSGVVTPVSIGSTNITATASGTTSAAYAVKVYPSNTSPINIATALEIATLAGTTAAPYKYISSGTVTAVSQDGRSYTLTDGTGSITVYKYNHGKAVNDVVTIQGDLINFEGNTKEYTNTTYCYNVTFNTNGGTGSFGPYNNVTEGSKISNPGTPTKAENTFIGWFNGNTEWDFDDDTVTGPLTLTAKWASNAAQTAINNKLESINAYMSLAYKYNASSINTPSVYTKATSISQLSEGDSIIIISKLSNGTFYAMTNSLDNNTLARSSEAITIEDGVITSEITSDFVWTLYGNAVSGWDLKNGTNYINNSNGSASIAFSNKVNHELAFVASGNNSYFLNNDSRVMMDGGSGFKNYASSNIGKTNYASEIYVYVKQATAKTSYDDVNFRIRCAIDGGIAELNEDYAVTFGIEVSAGGNTVKYANGSGASFQTAGGKQFVTLDLGDMLNINYANLDTEFTIRAYVEYNGAYFYSTNTKTYSVKGMVNQYYNVEHIDAVSGLKEILENYGYTFE